jgi:hypothetical protein
MLIGACIYAMFVNVNDQLNFSEYLNTFLVPSRLDHLQQFFSSNISSYVRSALEKRIIDQNIVTFTIDTCFPVHSYFIYTFHTSTIIIINIKKI